MRPTLFASVVLTALAMMETTAMCSEVGEPSSGIVSNEDVGSDPSTGSGADSDGRSGTYSFQCESCRTLVKTAFRGGVAGGAAADGAQQSLCDSLRRTSTQSHKYWSDDRMKMACATFMGSTAGQSVQKALTPYEVCKRMGHCGTTEERAAARVSAYNSRPAAVVRRAVAARPAPKTLSPEEAMKKAKAEFEESKKSWLPKLTKVTPLTGPPGTSLVIAGEGFDKGSACLFDRIASPASVYVSSKQMKCEVPHREEPGKVSVQVIGRSANGNTHLSDPVVFEVTKKK